MDKLYCLLPFAYIGILRKQLSSLKLRSILDVGGGYGETFRRVRQLVPFSYSMGLDIYAPYIAQAKSKNIYDDYILAQASSLPLKDRSFDIVIALQLIEHIDKEGALNAIKEMERVANKKVIIAVPRGLYPQEAFNGNPYQAHKSVWDMDELESLGYKVILYGTRFVRYTGTFWNKLFSYFLSVIGLFFAPRRTAGGIICVKDIG